jgi:hypothetical protein
MTMVAVLFLGMFYILTPHAYAATNMAIVNPLDGTNSFTFTTDDLPVGSTFAINLTVIGATDLATWQARVEWNPAFLEFVSFVFPSDDVFFNKSPIRAPTDSSVPGSMLAGAVAGPGAGSFTGTGTLGVLTLKILDGADSTCPIQYTNLGSDTFLLDINGNDIVFTLINGVYTLTKVAAGKPSFKLQPSPIKPLKKGDTFTVDVMVSGVDPGAEIIGFQYSIMWDTSLIAPTAPYFANGSFLETFQYNEGGVIYATDINAHNRPPPDNPIAVGWNYSTVGEILMTDSLANNTYHAPFPSGSGRLGTFYFKAIYDTVAPIQIISSIDFIPEDFLVLSALGENFGYKTATGAVYYAPMTSLGLAIDLYTQYPDPYGGQGGNMTSDSFSPQQEINLCAKLTYNDFGVPGKLVAFEITHKSNASDVTFHFAREATTDANGVACITFKIPWNGPDSAGDVFGWWYVNATGDVGGDTTVDNLRFYVWWPVEVTSIEPKFSSATQRVGGGGDPMNFTMVYLTYHIQPQDVLLTGTIHDELQFFIGSSDTLTTVNAPDYTATLPWTEEPPTPGTFDWNFTVPLSPNAVVGKGTAFGNAFNTWPWNGGVAYCPEMINKIDFFISKPT